MDKNINLPLVSVLMPVYNSDLYIQRAIESILNQTFNNFEFLIINDCSTDNSLEIINSFKDSRIIVLNTNENSGISKTLNYGLKQAKGKYIIRMDSDDISFPLRIENQIKFLEENPEYVLCGSNYSIIGSKNKVILPKEHNTIKANLLQSCCVAHPTVAINKEYLDKNNLLYTSEMEPAEDYYLWSQLIFKGKFYNLQEELLDYRVHEKQISQKNKIAQDKKSFEVKLSYLKSFYKNLTNKEINILEKHFILKNKIEEPDLEVLEGFIVKVKKANIAENFCDRKSFKKYTSYLENVFLTSLFSKNERYALIDFIYYLKIERMYKLKLNLKMKTRLLLKSIFFYKIKSFY